ncbi:hypothetical protein MKW98_014002, partial [Papaver atlanticum]
MLPEIPSLFLQVCNPSFAFIRFFFWSSSVITRRDSNHHDLYSMEVCQYTEEALDAAIKKFEGFGKTLVFKPSRDMAATKSTKDLHFEEMESFLLEFIGEILRLAVKRSLFQTTATTTKICFQWRFVSTRKIPYMLPSENLKASARLLCLNHLVIWPQSTTLKTGRRILRSWKGIH